MSPFSILCSAMLCAASCAVQSIVVPQVIGPELLSSQNFLYGDINAAFVQKLREKSYSNRILFIASGGGDPTNALDAADIIREQRVGIRFIADCSSACSEILLPAASRYSVAEFFKDPLIGFHHNILFTQRAFKTAGRNDFSRCFGALLERFQDLRAKTKVPVSLWKKQAEYLRTDFSKTGARVDCEHAAVFSERLMWYPTSVQLKREFHLNFSGSVCADDVSCVHNRLNQLQMRSGQYIIGTKVYYFNRETGELKSQETM